MAHDPQPEAGEQRGELRVPLRVMHVKLEGQRKVFFGYADNLSTSGLFIQSINPRDPGSRFRIEFRLPGTADTIECVAEVAWKRDFTPSAHYKPGMGMRFVEIDSDFVGLIRKFIEKARAEQTADERGKRP